MSAPLNNPRETIVIHEREEEELQLPESDIDRLQELKQLQVDRIAPEKAIVESKGYVGAVGLPSGSLIEIWPKVNCNLLYLLAYDDRLDDELVFGDATGFRMGESFVEIIARLYTRELKRVLKRGLHQTYRERAEREKHLRGRLDLQRQLQYQEPHGTDFEVEYDDLTYDTALNQVVLRATAVLLQLVDDPTLLSELNRYHGMLRQRLEPRELTQNEIDSITLTRLSDYYRSLLEIAQMILDHSFIDEIGPVQTEFRTFLVNIEHLFENVVQRAVQQALINDPYLIDTGQRGYLIKGETHGTLQGLKPDFTVTHVDTGEVVLVGDAKWKIDPQPARDDLYQISTYMAKFDVPGILVYPDQDGVATDHYTFDIDDAANPHRPLYTTEVPFTADDYNAFKESIERTVREQIQQLLEYL